MADSSKPRANTAFDNSSFPQPLNPLPETQYPPSIISSRMTDAGSEDGEDFRPPSSRPATSGRPMSSRPAPGPLVGDRPGDSRPSTALSSHRGTPSQPPPSRRGVLGLNGVRSSNVGSVSGSIGTARPPSAASRTHVPSLTSHAFFKPMSSQRLQAQRNVRATAEPAKELEEYHEVETNPNRYSFSSNPTTRYGPVVHQEHDPMPESRDTNATDREALGTSHTNPDGHGPSQSLTESVRPLQQGPKNNNHGLNAGTAYRSGGMASAASKPVSQPSFRSSFKLSSRGGTKTGIEQGREKLSSTSSSPRQGPTKMDMAKSQNRKNYEYFTGNTSFCWGGRLQNAHDRPINILTGLIVVLPVALFFGFSAPWLWKHASPAVPVVFAYVFAVCISSFVHASVTDPGILPRNLHQFPPMAADEDPLALGPPTMAWTTIKSIGTPGLVMEELTKHCKTCNIWRPPRAHHCRVCNNCVETQDHHCVWLNNCIGRRNYRYFFAFVSSGTIVGLYLIGASLAHLLLYHKMQADSFGKAINHNRVVFALVIYGLLATPYPASLLGYHLFLMGKGETTRELLNSHKVAPKDRHRPFTTGNLFTNWVVVLGRPRPPTYLHFKRKYEEGDQRFGSERGRRKAPLKKQHPQGGMEMEPVKAVAHPTAAPPMKNNATSGEQTS